MPTVPASSHRSIREKAYEYTQRKILTGELAPGTAISELALAKELGSSRTPIREALGQLVAEGFLEQIPQRGTVVVELQREDIIELYELREALEVYAVGKVARQGLSPADHRQLQAFSRQIHDLQAGLQNGGGGTLTPEQMRKQLNADLALHTLLLRAANNRRILKVVGDTRLLIRIFAMRHVGHDAAQLADICSYHDRVVEAVARGDANQAMDALGEHIRLSRQERLDEFDRQEREASIARHL